MVLRVRYLFWFGTFRLSTTTWYLPIGSCRLCSKYRSPPTTIEGDPATLLFSTYGREEIQYVEQSQELVIDCQN